MAIQRAPGPGENGVFGTPAAPPTPQPDIMTIARLEYENLITRAHQAEADVHQLRAELNLLRGHIAAAVDPCTLASGHVRLDDDGEFIVGMI